MSSSLTPKSFSAFDKKPQLGDLSAATAATSSPAYSNTLANFDVSDSSARMGLDSSGSNRSLPDPKDFLDRIRLNTSNDVLTIRGSAANDKVTVDANLDTITVTVRGIGAKEFDTDDVAKVVFFGGLGNDEFFNRTGLISRALGQGGDDLIVGGTGLDVFKGGAGNDTLRGRSGDDRILGGIGNDLIFGGSGLDLLLGQLGDDEIRGGAGVDKIIGNFGVDQIFGGNGADNIFGGFGDDILHGGSLDDRIFGGAGLDKILGGSGNDLLMGNVFEQIIGGAGLDNIDDWVGNLVLSAPDNSNSIISNLTNRLLVIRGTNGDDVINVTANGNNIVIGSRSYAASGVNRIVIAGHAGNDQITVDAAVQKGTLIYGGWGNDDIEGGSRRDEIYGGSGLDDINGNGGNDVIYGGAQSDRLNGGPGTDVVRQNSIGTRARAMTSFEKQIHNLVNKRRLQNGLTALTVNNRLAAAADFHSANIRRRIGQTNTGTGFAHSLWGVLHPTVDNRIDYAGFEMTGFGENLALGPVTPADVVNAWMGSSGHRANILNPDFEFSGVGVVKLPDGTKIHTHVFGIA